MHLGTGVDVDPGTLSLLANHPAALLHVDPVHTGPERSVHNLAHDFIRMNSATERRPRPHRRHDRDARHRHECLYGYTCLPIYCMHTARVNDIVDNTVKIPIRMIQEFGRADGWIGIVRYDSFARLADRHIADDGSIYAHGPISYGVPGPKLIREIFEGIPHNLVIKTPKYAYQQEYRIIGSRPVECHLLPDENHPGCKIEKYDHAELDLGCNLADFSRKASVPSLEETLNAPLDKEASELVGTERPERTAGREAYRSGHYARKSVTGAEKVELSVCFEYRKASPNAAASGPLGRSHLGLMSTKLALAVG